MRWGCAGHRDESDADKVGSRTSETGTRGSRYDERAAVYQGLEPEALGHREPCALSHEPSKAPERRPEGPRIVR